MRGILCGIVAALLSVTLAGVPAKAAAGKDVPLMTKEELRPMLGNLDVIILDVRIEQQWREAERKITGAVRENHKDVKSWADKYPKDKTLVLY